MSLPAGITGVLESRPHIDAWIYGHMDTWTYRHMDIRTPGHMDIWTHGHVEICKSETMDES